MFREMSVVLALTACAAAQQPSPPSEDAVVPVFELEQSERGGGITIDPILLLREKQIEPVPDPCTEGPALTQFNSEYLKPGDTYSVVFGGTAAGSVTIRTPPPNSADTPVRLDSSVSIRGMTMALAIPSSKVSHKKGIRRDPTSDERKQAEELARMILIEKGVQPSTAAKLRLDQLAIVDFAPGTPEIVASVAVEPADESRMEESLFFIAKTTGRDPHVLWYQHPQGETEAEAEAVYLVDMIDLDGDGTNELVARRAFYENYRYEVYKQQGAEWKEIFQTDVFGCL